MRQYICKQCRKQFSRPCLLERHLVVHSNAKPFKCPQCNKDFSQKSSLQRHERHSHLGQKKHQCSKCSAEFSQHSNLVLHIKRTHPPSPEVNDGKQKFYACEKCTCIFSRLNSLHRHLHKSHSNVSNISLMQTQPQVIGLDRVDPMCNSANDNEATTAAVVKDLTKQFNHLQDISGSSIKEKSEQAAPREPDQNTSQDSMDGSHVKIGDLRHQIEYLDIEKTINELLQKEKDDDQHELFLLQDFNFLIGESPQEEPSPYFTCAICQKKFRYDMDLRFHKERYHNPKIPFNCSYCLKGFWKKSACQHHMRLHRYEDKYFSIERSCKSLEEMEQYIRKRDFYTVLKKCKTGILATPKYECGYCRRIFKADFELKVHYRVHRNHERWTCPIYKCQASYKRFCHLATHKIVIHPKSETFREFLCHYCPSRFRKKRNCLMHLTKHLRLFKEREVAESAKSTRKPITPSSANFIEIQEVRKCKKHKHRNVTIENLNRMLNESQEIQAETPLSRTPTEGYLSPLPRPKNPCHLCPKEFQKPSDLQRHLRSHTKDRPHSCAECGRSFTLKSSLHEHRLVHLPQKERPKFQCKICCKSYASQKSLNIHLRLHTGEYPFRCEGCDKNFRTSGHYLAHMKTGIHYASSQRQGDM